MDQFKFLESKMNKEEFEQILEQEKDLKSLPNTKLIECMDKLTTDFEMTKSNIINSTLYLDKVEELYNKFLKEFQTRK